MKNGSNKALSKVEMFCIGTAMIMTLVFFLSCQKILPPRKEIKVIMNLPNSFKKEKFISFIDVEKRRSILKKLSSKNILKYCQKSAPTYAKAYPVIKLSGPIHFAESNLNNFMIALNRMIDQYLSGTDSALKNIKKTLHDAARINAFEKVTPNAFNLKGYNPYNEPIFHQTLLLLPIGIIYPELIRIYGLQDKEMEDIRAWVNRVFASVDSGKDNFIGRSRGVDRAAAKAAAFSVWGASTQNRKILQKAYYYFQHAISRIDEEGKIKEWAFKGKDSEIRRYHNMTYGFAVIAAEVFYINGLQEVYDLPSKTKSLKKGVDWLVPEAIEEKDPFTQVRMGHGARTLSWMEIYAARFPNRPASQIVRKKLKHRLFGNLIGGSTTCMFRPISP